MQSIASDFASALLTVSDLKDSDARLKAYASAGVDISMMTLDAIREADRLAVEQEIGRRVSRS